MDWIERLNSSIDYIEDHLTEKIDFEEIAKVALCSSYHFQRMFSYMAEMTISEYVRRRRMSKAAVELFDGEKVINVALKYGYDSPTAFSRAFKIVHKIAPSKIKSSQNLIKSFTPIRFAITIKGAMEMNYKLVRKEEFRVVGISKNIFQDFEKNFSIIPAMWDEAAKDGTLNKICSLIGEEPNAVLGISFCNDASQWKYAIAVRSNEAVKKPLMEFIVPAATWAVFRGEGPSKSIQELAMRVHTEWLPSSGYEFGNAPEIEVYYSPDPEDSTYELWLPVVTNC